MITPEPIKKLIEQFTKFPGIGPRQASRFAFYLVNAPKEQQTEFLQTIAELKKINLCPQCGFISTDTLCNICADNKRNKKLLAVVERATDLLSLERAGHYKGFYFILGGNIYSNKDLNISPLKKRVEQLKRESNGQLEIILALNPTTEGEATALFVEKELQKEKVKISRLGRGLPSGADLEYADSATLEQAFESRKQIHK